MTHGLDRDGWPSADTVLATERRKNAELAAENAALRKTLNCRAGRLLLSGTPFFVVKASEPYAHDVVELIKQHEGENWTSDDQAWANAAMGENRE